MNILRRKTVIIGLVLILAWLGNGLYDLHARRATTIVQLSDIESKVKDTEDEQAFLASASAYFSSDAYLERQARLKLNYKLPDEEVAFVYRDTSEKAVSIEEALKDRIARLPNWQKWWYWLRGY